MNQSPWAAAALTCSTATAQFCEPQFEPVGTLSGPVNALAIHDDGSGLSLFAGGAFAEANGLPVSNIARWNGLGWSPLGVGVRGGGIEAVRSLATFDDGSGPGLYVAGAFTEAGLFPANRIARWNGQAWSTLGQGVDALVRTLVVFDEDGAGPLPAALFAGGEFVSAGGGPALRVARWDGKAWSAVGSGIDAQGALVRSLAVFDDGKGPALYATGTFASIGNLTVSNVARWDGQEWTGLGAGLSGGNGATLSVCDLGDGPNLYAGGNFTKAGEVPAQHIARWDGHDWSAMGEGLLGSNVRAIVAYDDGGGRRLYAGGQTGESACWRWTGGSWEPFGGAVNGYAISMLAAHAPEEGVYIGGDFDEAGGEPVGNMTLWAGCPRCAPDCDGSGELDLFDFLCFVNLFNGSDPAADCDASGALDLFDFLCFVNTFNEGC